MTKRRFKKKLCLDHRRNQYNVAIQGVIDGILPPEYATERFQKLKEVKGK